MLMYPLPMQYKCTYLMHNHYGHNCFACLLYLSLTFLEGTYSKDGLHQSSICFILQYKCPYLKIVYYCLQGLYNWYTKNSSFCNFFLLISSLPDVNMLPLDNPPRLSALQDFFYEQIVIYLSFCFVLYFFPVFFFIICHVTITILLPCSEFSWGKQLKENC